VTQTTLAQQIERAKELLRTVRHAAMATVNADGTPHNSPYFFMRDDRLEHLYWGSHPESIHSQNILRTGRLFVVLYDAQVRGGLYVEAANGHPVEGDELVTALAVHNALRAKEGRSPIPQAYYQGDSPQRMWMADVGRLWVNGTLRDADDLVVRDIRTEITAVDLL
jgi:hypothetical protein